MLQYDWKRFWCQRVEEYSFSTEGYLADPEDRLWGISSKHLKTIEELSSLPCLVLLGEPGIGKTTILQQEEERLRAIVQGQGDKSLFVNLSSIGSDERLYRCLFENADIEAWKESAYTLHLFLDSFDECLIRVTTLASILCEELPKLPTHRLKLRIACRTAVWPSELESTLGILWKDNTGVYELLPLRRKDVENAALANNLAPEPFLQDLYQAGAVPFAIKPSTLKFLIEEYQRTKTLPSSLYELYLKGCIHLCEEHSKSRNMARDTRNLTSHQRLAIAERIAALTIFTGKNTIYVGNTEVDCPENAVSISQIAGGREEAAGGDVEVTLEGALEALDTGLFTSRGAYFMGWAHQTYAEFLAARFVERHKLTLPQIMSLIGSQVDVDFHFVPQLYETAGWIASSNPEALNQAMQTEPDVILRSDVAATSAEVKAEITGQLLQKCEEHLLRFRDLPDARHLRKLNHTRLPEELRPFLVSLTGDENMRCAAIEIAEACKMLGLQQDLLNIALNSREPDLVRVQSAYALLRIGEPAYKEKLRPLADGSIQGDANEDLKGCALSALWPDIITSKDLFSLLHPPKNTSYHGAYSSFLHFDMPNGLNENTVCDALNWITFFDEQQSLDVAIRQITVRLLSIASAFADKPHVQDAIANLLVRFYDSHESVCVKHDDVDELLFLQNNEARLEIASRVIQQIKDIHNLHSNSLPILLLKDWKWLIEKYRNSFEVQVRERYLLLIPWFFVPSNESHLSTVLNLIEEDPNVHETFVWQIGPIAITSELAIAMRQHYELEQNIQRNRLQRVRTLQPTPSDRVQVLLEQFESGSIDAWWQMSLTLQFEPEDTHNNNDFEGDITKLPGWQSADEATRQRILSTAHHYLLNGSCNTNSWLGVRPISGQFILHHPALAGYRALLLLARESPSDYGSLSIGTWQEWTPIILASPCNDSEHPCITDLICRAYQYAPEQFLNTLAVVLGDNSHPNIFQDIQKCWDNNIAKLVWSAYQDDRLHQDIRHPALLCLLQNAEATDTGQVVIVEVRDRLQQLFNNGDRSKEVTFLASALLSGSLSHNWDFVFSLLQQDDSFGKNVIEDWIPRERHQGNAINTLNERQLEQLYLFLVKMYPYENDPDYRDVYYVSPSDEAIQLRNAIIPLLTERGTKEACEVLSRINTLLSEYEWLGFARADAIKNMRRKTWEPPTPLDILNIAKSNEARFVQSEEQLLQVILESLQRAQRRLQDEIPQAPLLWNMPYGGVVTHKDENTLSHWVADHLKQDLVDKGIIVNREVEIRPNFGGALGEITDIHIIAAKPNNGGTIEILRVIIETKGCWHHDILTAMQTQLVERYLKDNSCHHGVYLVGWYHCTQWEPKSEEKKEDLQTRLENQANQLTVDGQSTIRSFMLDVSLRAPKQAEKGTA